MPDPKEQHTQTATEIRRKQIKALQQQEREAVLVKRQISHQIGNQVSMLCFFPDKPISFYEFWGTGNLRDNAFSPAFNMVLPDQNTTELFATRSEGLIANAELAFVCNLQQLSTLETDEIISMTSRELGGKLFSQLNSSYGNHGLGKNCLTTNTVSSFHQLLYQAIGRSTEEPTIDLQALNHGALMQVADHYIYGVSAKNNHGKQINSNPRKAAIICRLAIINPNAQSMERCQALQKLAAILFRGDTIERLQGIFPSNKIMAFHFLCQAIDEANNEKINIEEIEKSLLFVLSNILFENQQTNYQYVELVLNRLQELENLKYTQLHLFLVHQLLINSVKAEMSFEPILRSLCHSVQNNRIFGQEVLINFLQALLDRETSFSIIEINAIILQIKEISDVQLKNRCFIIINKLITQKMILMTDSESLPFYYAINALNNQNDELTEKSNCVELEALPETHALFALAQYLALKLKEETLPSIERSEEELFQIENSSADERRKIAAICADATIAKRFLLISQRKPRGQEEKKEEATTPVGDRDDKDSIHSGRSARSEWSGVQSLHNMRCRSVIGDEEANQGKRLFVDSLLEARDSKRVVIEQLVQSVELLNSLLLEEKQTIEDLYHLCQIMILLGQLCKYREFEPVRQKIIPILKQTNADSSEDKKQTIIKQFMIFYFDECSQNTEMMKEKVFLPKALPIISLNEDEIPYHIEEEMLHFNVLNRIADLFNTPSQWGIAIMPDELQTIVNIVRFFSLLPFDRKYGYGLDFKNPETYQEVERLIMPSVNALKIFLENIQDQKVPKWFSVQFNKFFSVQNLPTNHPIRGIYNIVLDKMSDTEALQNFARQAFAMENTDLELEEFDKKSGREYLDNLSEVGRLNQNLVRVFKRAREDLKNSRFFKGDEFHALREAMQAVADNPAEPLFYLALDDAIVHAISDRRFRSVLRIVVLKWILRKNSLIVKRDDYRALLRLYYAYRDKQGTPKSTYFKPKTKNESINAVYTVSEADNYFLDNVGNAERMLQVAAINSEFYDVASQAAEAVPEALINLAHLHCRRLYLDILNRLFLQEKFANFSHLFSKEIPSVSIKEDDTIADKLAALRTSLTQLENILNNCFVEEETLNFQTDLTNAQLLMQRFESETALWTEFANAARFYSENSSEANANYYVFCALRLAHAINCVFAKGEDKTESNKKSDQLVLTLQDNIIKKGYDKNLVQTLVQSKGIEEELSCYQNIINGQLHNLQKSIQWLLYKQLLVHIVDQEKENSAETWGLLGTFCQTLFPNAQSLHRIIARIKQEVMNGGELYQELLIAFYHLQYNYLQLLQDNCGKIILKECLEIVEEKINGWNENIQEKLTVGSYISISFLPEKERLSELLVLLNPKPIFQEGSKKQRLTGINLFVTNSTRLSEIRYYVSLFLSENIANVTAKQFLIEASNHADEEEYFINCFLEVFRLLLTENSIVSNDIIGMLAGMLNYCESSLLRQKIEIYYGIYQLRNSMLQKIVADQIKGNQEVNIEILLLILTNIGQNETYSNTIRADAYYEAYKNSSDQILLSKAKKLGHPKANIEDAILEIDKQYLIQLKCPVMSANDVEFYISLCFLQDNDNDELIESKQSLSSKLEEYFAKLGASNGLNPYRVFKESFFGFSNRLKALKEKTVLLDDSEKEYEYHQAKSGVCMPKEDIQLAHYMYRFSTQKPDELFDFSRLQEGQALQRLETYQTIPDCPVLLKSMWSAYQARQAMHAERDRASVAALCAAGGVGVVTPTNRKRAISEVRTRPRRLSELLRPGFRKGKRGDKEGGHERFETIAE